MLDYTALMWTYVAAGFFLFLTYCFALGIWRGRNQVASGKAWARTKGEVIESKVVVENFHTDDDDSDCTVAVRYRYAVAQKTYESDRIAFGDAGHTMRLLAQQAVAKYPTGAKVDVFYNPKRPSQAVLEGDSGAPAAFYAAVLVFGSIAAVLVAHSIAGKVLYAANGVPMFAFLVPLAALGIAGLCVYAFFDILRKEKFSARWPTATGKVTVSKVAEHASRDKDDNVEIRFVPQVACTYEVGGREYRCATRKWGWTELYVDSEGPEKILTKYPKGGSVPVFYNPADPSESVLEPANRRGTFAPVAGALTFALPAVLFLWMFIYVIE
ncbi:DUF3592 domain-containing protein [Rhodoplanes sp. Z2-YC6860]|uniref:DUF3592 domain-containing protein n=1 Tax=Rhodoplanes sp. Z2-YC6860 TaxID=674703 RepID=UPI00078DCF32|nr:DUF3592 domain-containing protein [Rhodoplanes sp. Z2-YC6860]AMN40004.1 hypothetical protein RHPLAN_15490 [Rhodoplanes sp. Z2-YC6860]